MPRPARALGRPGTAVVPGEWEAGHRPVIAAALNVPVTLLDPADAGDLVWDDELEQMVAGENAGYWTGLAGIQAMKAGGRTGIDVVGDAVTVVGYQVTLPATSQATEEAPDVEPLDAVAVGHLVLVDAGWEGDRLLAGRTLQVGEVVRGGLRFERVVFAQLVDDVKG